MLKNLAIAFLFLCLCFTGSPAEQQGATIVNALPPECTCRIDRQDYIVGCYIEGYVSGVYSARERWTTKENQQIARDAIAMYEAYELERQQIRNQK